MGGGAPGGAGLRIMRITSIRRGPPGAPALLRLLLGPEASAAAGGHKGSQDDEGNKHQPDNEEAHIDGDCRAAGAIFVHAVRLASALLAVIVSAVLVQACVGVRVLNGSVV